MRFQMVTRPGYPDFLDLPWHLPLVQWRSERLVEVARGISRHVVRFANYDGALFALKELPQRLAEREYRLLRHLAEQMVPVVDVVGVVSGRTTNPAPGGRGPGGRGELDAVLITRHLEFSLPYRVLFTSQGVRDLRSSLLDALAELLVRLHLAGLFWGDCSLSNTLFRRDAGALVAYLVDAETAERHRYVSDGLRAYELEIAQENVAGELMDLDAAVGLPPGIDPVATARELMRRYDDLWCELTREEVFGPDERYRIEARVRRLNALGFDVKELELMTTEDGDRLRLRTRVVEPGYHQRQLLMLTGLDVQENQARRLLNDIASFRVHLERREKQRPVPEEVAAYRWLAEVFTPTIAAVPADLRGKLEPAEIFHQVLEHRWYLSEAAKRDVGMRAAVASYVENVLRFVPDERTVLAADDPEALDAAV